MNLRIRISASANSDIRNLWLNGAEQFGRQVANDYDALIRQAIKDLAEEPNRPGSRRFKNEIYAYPLAFSNRRAGKRIRKPTHAILYFVVENTTLVIAAVTRLSRQRFINQLDIKAMLVDIEEK